MPRKKEFDVDDVMQKAMVAFWDRGYRATSLDDLVACMCINRASLYATFGDKYALFIEALHNYNRIYGKILFVDRMKAYPPREAILSLFEEIVDRALKGEERKGCLIINAAMELSPHDERVAKITKQTFSYVEKKFFRKLIKQGQASGEISKSVVPTKAARILLSLFIGLRVLSRNHPEKVFLNTIKNQVTALLPLGENGRPSSPPHRPLLQESEA